MHLVNYLGLDTAYQLFISASRYSMGAELVGPKNGSNYTYTVPYGHKVTHNLPYITIQVYLNGQRLRLLDDFLLAESEGPGSGYDTVLFEYAPRARDYLTVDYIMA